MLTKSKITMRPGPEDEGPITSLIRMRPRRRPPASETECRMLDFPELSELHACERIVMRATKRRPDFPFVIRIFHRDPDPFDYCIASRTASDAAAAVARMRALGRGAWIEEVDG